MKRIILFNLDINSTLAQMKMSVVLNDNEIPVKEHKMGTFNEFILINTITVTIYSINNGRTTKIKYHQLLPTCQRTVNFSASALK